MYLLHRLWWHIAYPARFLRSYRRQREWRRPAGYAWRHARREVRVLYP